MKNKTIFVLTTKGVGELKKQTSYLSEELRRSLALVDGKSTIEKLKKRAAPSLRSELSAMLVELRLGGFIQIHDKSATAKLKALAAPSLRSGPISRLRELVNGRFNQYIDKVRNMPRMAAADKADVEGASLDLTIAPEVHKPAPNISASDADKAEVPSATTRTDGESKAKSRTRERQASKAAPALLTGKETTRSRVEAEAALLKAAQEEVAARAQLNAADAEGEADATRLKQQQEAATVKALLENADAEAEAALFKNAQEEVSVQVASAAEVQLEIANAEADARLFADAKAARLKSAQEAVEAQLEIARAEAEARIFAEAKAARIKAEQEVVAAQARLDAFKAEAEARILAEAEAARLKEERQAAEERAQLELTKVEEEVARLRAEAEAMILAEAEAAHLKEEQQVAAAKAQFAIAKAEEQAKTEAEAKARAKAESARTSFTDGEDHLGAPTTSDGASDKTPRSKPGGMSTGFEFLSGLVSPNSPPRGFLSTLREVLFNTPESSSVARIQSSLSNTEKEESSTRIDDLNKVLKTLQSSSPGIEASALISTDGLMIASVMGQDMDATRIGAMTATLLSLGTRAGTELRRGELREVIVSGDNGYAVMVSAGRGVLLLILATEATPLGLIFIDMRDAIEAVKHIL